MINPYSHFYLYAKGHYKKGDKIEDLKKIQSSFCGVDHRYLTEHDLMQILIPLAYKHISQNESLFYNLLSYIDPNSLINMYSKDNYNFQNGLINGILSTLRWIHPKDIEGELAEADKNILPLK